MPITTHVRPFLHPTPPKFQTNPKPSTSKPSIPKLPITEPFVSKPQGNGGKLPFDAQGVKQQDGKSYVQLTGNAGQVEVARDSSGALREVLPNGSLGDEVSRIGNTNYFRRKQKQSPQASTLDRIKSPEKTKLGFSERMRSKERKPEDTTLAKLSRDVYSNKGSNIDGFVRLTPEELAKVGIAPSDLVNPKSGLDAAIYRNDKGEYVLAFAGTADRKDIKSDVKQGLGLSDKQYADAVRVAKKAKKAFGGSLVLTGHSLGGGLASLTALVVDAPAVTFNAAGVHDRTLRRNGLDPDAARKNAGNGLVRSYYVQGEMLSDVQDKVAPLPNPLGARIGLPPAKPYSSNTFISPNEALRQHGSEQVVDAMNASGSMAHVA